MPITDKGLAAIHDAMNFDTGDGRDLSHARELADAYVAAHPKTYTGWADITLPELVARVDAARANGDDNTQWALEAWILHRYEPQNIGGTYQPQIRVS